MMSQRLRGRGKFIFVMLIMDSNIRKYDDIYLKYDFVVNLTSESAEQPQCVAGRVLTNDSMKPDKPRAFFSA